MPSVIFIKADLNHEKFDVAERQKNKHLKRFLVKNNRNVVLIIPLFAALLSKVEMSEDATKKHMSVIEYSKCTSMIDFTPHLLIK